MPALAILCLVAVTGLWVVRYVVERNPAPAIVLAVLFSIGVFYLQTVVRSDWPVGHWYHYMLCLGMPFAFCLGLSLLPGFMRDRERLLLVPLAAALVLASGSHIVSNVRITPDGMLYRTAFQLKDFSEDHPGVYAMGDRAGFVSYLLDDPLLQLEGLVGDTQTLNAIRQQDDLLEFLESRGVDYYIATNIDKGADGCWEAIEPLQAGPSAPKMRARICRDPVFSFEPGAGQKTMVFALREPE
jgi:hypothetical protein